MKFLNLHIFGSLKVLSNCVYYEIEKNENEIEGKKKIFNWTVECQRSSEEQLRSVLMTLSKTFL